MCCCGAVMRQRQGWRSSGASKQATWLPQCVPAPAESGLELRELRLASDGSVLPAAAPASKPPLPPAGSADADDAGDDAGVAESGAAAAGAVARAVGGAAPLEDQVLLAACHGLAV